MAQAQYRYGWCGLGQMGEAMAGNMLKAGIAVTVWNRSADKCEPLKELGASVGSTPQDVFEQSDVVFVMLSTPDVARAWWAENAKFAGGKFVIDCGTLGADTMKHLNDMISANGGKFLEAPVAGHSGMAKTKQIDFLCAGNRDAYDAVSVAMKTMSKGQVFFGEEVGKASSMKLIVNSTLGNMMATLAEGMCLTEKAGLSQEQYLSIIGNHPALSNGLFKIFGAKMLEGSHDPLFMTKHEAKDLGLAVDMATSVGQAMPMSKASCELHKAAIADGHGEKHMSVIYETLKKQAP